MSVQVNCKYCEHGLAVCGECGTYFERCRKADAELERLRAENGQLREDVACLTEDRDALKAQANRIGEDYSRLYCERITERNENRSLRAENEDLKVSLQNTQSRYEQEYERRGRINDDLTLDNLRLREALEFYAKPYNWLPQTSETAPIGQSRIQYDCGNKARKALGLVTSTEPGDKD